MRRHRLGLLAAALGISLAAAGAAAQVPVARVNGVEISSRALDRGFEQELRARNLNITRMQRPDQVRDIKREVLDRLIAEELLWQKARREGRVASDEDTARAVEQSAAQFRNRGAFERSIARDGFDEASYREHARRLLSADRAAQSLVEGKLEITDADIEAFYRANRALFHRPEQLRLRELMVRVAPEAGPGERAAARARADELRARLARGEDFADLARQYSELPTRQWGGALDPVPRGQLAAPLDEAAFRLKPGETSEVIETPAGYHLLRLDERIPEVTVPLASPRERIREHLTRLRGREVLEREVAALRAASKVEILIPL